MFREIRTNEKITEEKESSNKAYLKIKPSENFNMTSKEIEDFWLSEMMKAREEMHNA